MESNAPQGLTHSSAQGSLRCDVNVSVQNLDNGARSSRCEIKNVNGLGNIEAAIGECPPSPQSVRCKPDLSTGYEAQRHVELLEGGRRVDFETRGWDVGQTRTFTLRSKESAPEYRYMPDPDISPIEIDPVSVIGTSSMARTDSGHRQAICEAMAESVPELPDETVDRLVAAHGLSRRDAGVLALIGDSDGSLFDVGMGARFFDAAVESAQLASGKLLADWCVAPLCEGD